MLLVWRAGCYFAERVRRVGGLGRRVGGLEVAAAHARQRPLFHVSKALAGFQADGGRRVPGDVRERWSGSFQAMNCMILAQVDAGRGDGWGVGVTLP